MSKKTQELILSLQAEVASQRTVIRQIKELLDIANNRLATNLHNYEQKAAELERNAIALDERLTRAEKQMGLVV